MNLGIEVVTSTWRLSNCGVKFIQVRFLSFRSWLLYLGPLYQPHLFRMKYAENKEGEGLGGPAEVLLNGRKGFGEGGCPCPSYPLRESPGSF